MIHHEYKPMSAQLPKMDILSLKALSKEQIDDGFESVHKEVHWVDMSQGFYEVSGNVWTWALNAPPLKTLLKENVKQTKDMITDWVTKVQEYETSLYLESLPSSQTVDKIKVFVTKLIHLLEKIEEGSSPYRLNNIIFITSESRNPNRVVDRTSAALIKFDQEFPLREFYKTMQQVTPVLECWHQEVVDFHKALTQKPPSPPMLRRTTRVIKPPTRYPN